MFTGFDEANLTDATKPPVPPAVWLGLTLAVLLDVPVQLMWKALMAKYGSGAHGPGPVVWSASAVQVVRGIGRQARWFSHQTRTYGLLALFAAQFVNWMWVLGSADLSYAQPFTALSYVVVSSCAAVIFHEHLSPARITGIAIILAGVLLVGSTSHRTAAVAATTTTQVQS